MNTSFSLYSPSIWSLTEEERVHLESIKQISRDTASSSSEMDEIEFICASLPFVDIDSDNGVEDSPRDRGQPLESMKIVELEWKKNAVGSSNPVLINDHAFDKSDWQSRKITDHKMEFLYSLSKSIQ